MKKNIALAILITASLSYSQNLDSLFNKFLEVKGKTLSGHRVNAVKSEPEKCLFGIVNEVKRNFNNFSIKQKLVLSSMLGRPVTDTSFISPSGKFKIHFDKKGSNSPAYSMDELARIADYTYKYEVDSLKYPPPPNDGDGIYDIYVKNLGSGTYGYTELDSAETVTTSTSYTLINSDFSNFPTKGINAVKVTIAHEFHHAIQIGNYIYRPSDLYFHELSSTSMEEIVYNEVNDYHNYLPSYFSNPGKTITQNSGYNLAIWNLFLRDRFGVDIIKEIWERMPTRRAVECFSIVFEKHGSSLLKEFNEFGIWTYFTNTRTISGQYFKEADAYPLIKTGMQTALTNPPMSVKVTSEAISNYFTEITDGANAIVSLVTNADVQSSINDKVTLPFDLSISRTQSSGYAKIFPGYYAKLTSSSPALLADSYFFNGKLIGKIENMEYAFPQPFNYSKNSVLYFPAELTSDGTVELTIFSIDMNLVYSSQAKIVNGNKVVVMWNVLDDNGKKLSTGVYFYVVKCGDSIIKGKFVVLND